MRGVDGRGRGIKEEAQRKITSERACSRELAVDNIKNLQGGEDSGREDGCCRSCECFRASPDDIPDVQQASLGKASRTVGTAHRTAKRKCTSQLEASAAHLAGRRSTAHDPSGCNSRIIKMSLERPRSTHCSGHDLQLPMPNAAQKNVRDKPRGDTDAQRDKRARNRQQLPSDKDQSTLLHRFYSLCLQVVPVQLLLLQNVQETDVVVLDLQCCPCCHHPWLVVLVSHWTESCNLPARRRLLRCHFSTANTHKTSSISLVSTSPLGNHR